ncbi:glutathione peroxidase [Cereibacter sp. SYSU M97828]|nr:glutathione peroxidase [Cereibacter flavus]
MILLCVFLPGAALAAMPHGLHFDSIDGGEIAMDGLRGRPILVVNTASRCAFTAQYDDLQALADRYPALAVLAVPSGDFRQELASGAQVAEFCAMNFDLAIPITDITAVTGTLAHPLYAWLRQEHGFTPGWNFNKVLIAPDGELDATWGSAVSPRSPEVIRRIEALLP